MLDTLQYMGVNATREHQRVIARLTARLFAYFEVNHLPYEPLPEVMIDSDKTSPTPDIIVSNDDEQQDLVLIEVANKGAKADFLKVAELVDKYEVPEGFVYNYLKKTWRKYKLGVGEVTENPSFCDAIGYDLDHFLQ